MYRWPPKRSTFSISNSVAYAESTPFRPIREINYVPLRIDCDPAILLARWTLNVNLRHWRLEPSVSSFVESKAPQMHLKRSSNFHNDCCGVQVRGKVSKRGVALADRTLPFVFGEP